MQVGRTHLSPEKHERKIREHLFLYCRQMGHLRASCQTRPPQQSTPEYIPSSQLFCLLYWGTSEDGSAGNFIYEDLAQQFNIPLIPWKSPLVPELDGRPLVTGHILSSTTNITLQVGILHIIQLSLLYQCWAGQGLYSSIHISSFSRLLFLRKMAAYIPVLIILVSMI